jgi:hypothetical protein
MSVISTSLYIVGTMPFTSYGDFGRLPREIRDQIYEEYFAVDSPTSLEKYLENNESGVTFYITQSDKSLMRVSRALYREIHPVGTPQIFNMHVTDIASF